LTESSVDSTLAIIGQELSRLAIGGAAGVLKRTTEAVDDASKITQILVGRYPRTPVFVFVGLLYAYAALAIILFLSTVACSTDVISSPSDDDANKEKTGAHDTKPVRTYTALELAQRRLVDPATLIAEQYVWAPHPLPAQSSQMSSRTRTAEMFGINQPVGPGKSAPAPERLVVGLGGPYADTGNPRFGVWRRPKRQAELDADSSVVGSPSTGDAEMMESTTLVGSTIVHQQREGVLPPAYTSLGRGARTRSDGSDLAPEYVVRHGPGRVDTQRRAEGVRVDLADRRRLPEKDLSELMRVRSSVSSSSTGSERTVRRSTGV
jgi:hypothetical protein